MCFAAMHGIMRALMAFDSNHLSENAATGRGARLYACRCRTIA